MVTYQDPKVNGMERNSAELSRVRVAVMNLVPFVQELVVVVCIYEQRHARATHLTVIDHCGLLYHPWSSFKVHNQLTVPPVVPCVGVHLRRNQSLVSMMCPRGRG